MRFKRTIGVGSAVAIAVGTIATGLALAHGGDTGIVHSCVDKNGKIVIVDANATCGINETALDWSITGPPGPKGDKGDTGDTGPQGPAGAPGASGGPAANNQEVIGILDIVGTATSIEVLGFSFGATQSGTHAGGGGGGAGKVNFSDLTVTKAVDAASPELFFDTARGQHIQDVRLQLYRPGTTDVYMAYRLEDVLISAVHDSDDGRVGAQPLETLALNFAEIEWTFTPTTGSPVTRGWDVTQNEAT